MSTERYLAYVLFLIWFLATVGLVIVFGQLGILISIVVGTIVMLGYLRVLNKELDRMGEE